MFAITPIFRSIPYSFTFILLFISFEQNAFAQVAGAESDIFCGKKWYIEMIKSADGSIIPTDESKSGNYMHFLCDSNAFTLIDDSITLKGNWTFEEATMTITLHQKQLNSLPENFSFHIIEYDDSHLIILGLQGTASQETVHLYSK